MSLLTIIPSAILYVLGVLKGCQTFTQIHNFTSVPLTFNNRNKSFQSGLNELESQKVKSIHDHFIAETKKASENVPDTIPDLRNIFTQFGGTHHRSLLLLDNYHNINIPEPETPIIARRLIPGKLTISDIHKKAYYPYQVVFGWFPSTAEIINGTLPEYLYEDDPTFCEMSKYLTGVDRHLGNDLCTKLNLFIFVSFTKPWNGTVQISLFLPSYIMKDYQDYAYVGTPGTYFPYPRAFKYDRLLSSQFENILPPQAHNVHVVIAKQYENYTLDKTLKAIRFVNTPSEYRERLFHETVFIFQIFKVENSPLEVRTRLVQAERFNTKVAQLHWKFEQMQAPYTDKPISNSLLHQMLHCSPINSKSIIHGPTSTTDKIYRAIASVWLSIMHNYSYSISTNKLCVNGKVVESTINDVGRNDGIRSIKLRDSFYTGVFPQQYLLAIPDNIHSLAFISCGQRTIKRLPFEQLVNIFDKEVWLAPRAMHVEREVHLLG